MKFKISQAEFTKALLFCSSSLSTRTNLPILSNILITAAKGSLEVLSTNLETATKVVVACQVDVEGKTTVPGKLLFEFISQLPEGDVVVEKLGEEVIVLAKRYNGRFATAVIEDFPAIPKIEGGHTISIKPKEFAKAILRVAYCAALDEGRPILTGVLCEIGKNNLSFVATDGYRLSFARLEVLNEKAAAVKIVIPSKSIIEVAKLIAEYGEDLADKEIKMLISDGLNQVNFKVENVEYTSRLIEGAFPNWQKLIPAEFTSKAKISKEEFIKIVRVASIFARDGGNIVRLKLYAEGTKEGVLSVSGASGQVGSDEAQCEIELAGKGGEIAFNFRYLLEMLSSVDGEDVDFEMIESLNPGKLTVPGDKDYFHIIMPVRLQS